MEREDNYIVERFGRRTPFRVPFGYFDGIGAQVMQSIPSPSKATTAIIVPVRKSTKHGLRHISVAAASVCIAIWGVGAYLYGNRSIPTDTLSASVANVSAVPSYSAIDAMADYTMLDLEDMYTYMADNE